MQEPCFPVPCRQAPLRQEIQAISACARAHISHSLYPGMQARAQSAFLSHSTASGSAFIPLSSLTGSDWSWKLNLVAHLSAEPFPVAIHQSPCSLLRWKESHRTTGITRNEKPDRLSQNTFPVGPLRFVEALCLVSFSLFRLQA